MSAIDFCDFTALPDIFFDTNKYQNYEILWDLGSPCSIFIHGFNDPWLFALIWSVDKMQVKFTDNRIVFVNLLLKSGPSTPMGVRWGMDQAYFFILAISMDFFKRYVCIDCDYLYHLNSTPHFLNCLWHFYHTHLFTQQNHPTFNLSSIQLYSTIFFT